MSPKATAKEIRKRKEKKKRLVELAEPKRVKKPFSRYVESFTVSDSSTADFEDGKELWASTGILFLVSHARLDQRQRDLKIELAERNVQTEA